jgi:hypothetical protein
MTCPLEHSVLRILNPAGDIIGAGFVVGERLAVTCAHVIEVVGSAPSQPITMEVSHETPS